MKKIFFILILLIIAGFLGWKFLGKNNRITLKNNSDSVIPADSPLGSGLSAATDNDKLRSKIDAKYKNIIPKIWSERAPGVITKLNTDNKVLALTFDACGSGGDGYDKDLINYLSENKIPATLFITGKWIDKNSNTFKALSENNNFEIENHGTNHVPCSVSGKSAYNIAGENNPGEVVDEIEKNAERIESLTGRKPKFYRAATTFTDEVCPQIAGDLGEKIISFTLNGDGGATYDVNQIKNTLLKAPAGSIIIMHMNHPSSQTAEGLMATLPEMIKGEFKFVKLEDYQLK